jgi:hypothetical protein
MVSFRYVIVNTLHRGDNKDNNNNNNNNGGKIEGRIEVMGRRGRGRQQLLDDREEKRGYWKLKEEALDRTVWRTRFGGGCRPVFNTKNKMNTAYKDWI